VISEVAKTLEIEELHQLPAGDYSHFLSGVSRTIALRPFIQITQYKLGTIIRLTALRVAGISRLSLSSHLEQSP
jgi:hypothetical protein